jgi:hypothetical protein
MRKSSEIKGGKGAVACVAVVLATLLGWLSAAAVSDAGTVSALRIEPVGVPHAVHGSDGREHIDYDLVITNWFSADATLTSLDVRGDGKRLLSLRGARLGATTLRLGSFASTGGRVASGSAVVVLVDVALPHSAGRKVPAMLTNRISYSIPDNAPLRAVIGTTTVQVPGMHVSRPPVVIASPLRGTGWLDGNGCCDDPTSPHRHFVLATSHGQFIEPEAFAIDWQRLVDGRVFTGDGSKNSDFPTFGAPVYAVADGTVVQAVDGSPDIPPHSQNLELRTPDDFGGNHVILKIGPGRYACYAHIEHGSVMVHVGQRVRVGEQIGLAGNSGNTTGPHLHFGIQRQPNCLSESEPFEIDHFTLEGLADPTSPVPRIIVHGPPRHEHRSQPLVLSVTTLLPPGS